MGSFLPPCPNSYWLNVQRCAPQAGGCGGLGRIRTVSLHTVFPAACPHDNLYDLPLLLQYRCISFCLYLHTFDRIPLVLILMSWSCYLCHLVWVFCHLGSRGWHGNIVDRNRVQQTGLFSSSCVRLNAEYSVWYRHSTNQLVESAACNLIGSIWRNTDWLGSIYQFAVSSFEFQFPSYILIKVAFITSVGRGH